MGSTSEDRLVGVLIEFAQDLLTSYQVSEILYRLCDRTMDLLPVGGAGVMVADDDEVLRFVAASDETVRLIERFQIELGEGPCLHAFRTGEQVVLADLATTERFPRFRRRALEAGMRSVFSFPMMAGGQRVGAMNLYSPAPADFGPREREVGQVLADVATSYVLNARAFEETTRLAGQLRHALESRVVIEQAKGRLVEQLGMPVDDAFAALRRHARGLGVRLQTVAQDVVDGRLRLGEGEPADADGADGAADGADGAGGAGGADGADGDGGADRSGEPVLTTGGEVEERA